MTGSQFGRRRVSRRFWEASRLASLFKQSVAARGTFSQKPQPPNPKFTPGILSLKSQKGHRETLKSTRNGLKKFFKNISRDPRFFVIFAFKIWLKDPRAILPFGKDLAAREETTAVRGKHFENCFPLRLPLQKLFKLFLCFSWLKFG